MGNGRAPGSWGWGWVGVGLLVYAGAAGLAWLVSDRLLFQPDFGSRRAPAGAVSLKTNTGHEVSVLFLPNPAARLTLWYFHGNAEDLGDIEGRLRMLRDAGFAVFACEYPGYGISGGAPSERSINGATRVALDYLREQCGVPVGRILVYGSSLGGGPAVELASREPVAGLVLQSAFTSTYRVMTRWPLLPFDTFENLRKLPAVRCPLLIVHGEDDDVVPIHHGEVLFAAAREPKRFFRVKSAGHNDLVGVAGQDYWQALRELSDRL